MVACRPGRSTGQLTGMGVPHRVVLDGVSPSVITRGLVDVAVVGADRMAANGDVANKIGTYALAPRTPSPGSGAERTARACVREQVEELARTASLEIPGRVGAAGGGPAARRSSPCLVALRRVANSASLVARVRRSAAVAGNAGSPAAKGQSLRPCSPTGRLSLRNVETARPGRSIRSAPPDRAATRQRAPRRVRR